MKYCQINENSEIIPNSIISEKSEKISSSHINIKIEYAPTSEMKEKITEKEEYIGKVTTNINTIKLSTTSPMTIKDKTEHNGQPEKNPEKTIEIRTYNTIKPDIMTNIPSTKKETEIKKMLNQYQQLLLQHWKLYLQ